MEVHVRELFAGRWMDDKTADVEDSIENGRSVGIVRVNVHSNLSDLRKEIEQQISQDKNDIPRKFAFVEKLGKQLVEIWNEEEPILKVKNIVGREAEILIVERSADDNKQNIKKNTKMRSRRRVTRRQLADNDDDDIQISSKKGRKKSLIPQKEDRENLYSADEKRRMQRSLSNSARYRQSTAINNNRRQSFDGGQRFTQRRSKMADETYEPRHRSRRRSTSRGRRIKKEWLESDQQLESDSSPRISTNKMDFPPLDREERDEIERKRPATVRIRKERSMTEELRYPGDRPKIKNSIMKKSVSIDDLRSISSSPTDPDGFLTADSGRMEDYFMDRQPFSFSALNLRDMERQQRKRFEPSKMERRISGLLMRIRDVQEKDVLLKTIGQEHWRGRFYQLRRAVAPLEDRVQQLEDKEDDLHDNLIRLFDLGRNDGAFGASRKKAYILEAQKIQREVNQLNKQLENVDLDVLKYRKMQNITDKQTESLTRDINREKFLRHLLLDRSLQG